MNSISEPSDPIIRHTFWSVWSNPIFLRYCRSRLRLTPLGIWLLLTVLAAGFCVSIAVAIGMRTDTDPVDVGRGPIVPLLVIQGFILFVLGTAQAAGGMTAERDEGVIDYQRLIPMSPLAKVVGFLFGLPVREYVMFLATMPFMGWCLWQGEVSWQVWLPLYAVFLSTAVLYHLTGVVTGTVVRNRRWAFLASIGLVFALYTVIPQLANFGLVFFKYLTVSPMFFECLPSLIPKNAGAVVAAANNLAPRVSLFNLDFSAFTYTLFSQGGLILVFLVILCRKWRRYESHLLDKVWALGCFCWLQILFLGNALPLVEPGELFPSREIQRKTSGLLDWQPDPSEAASLAGVYGVLTLLLLLLFASIITPTPDRQMQGWRRARKLRWKRIPLLSDAACGWWFALGMAIAGGAGWYLFMRGVVESNWFPGQQVSLPMIVYSLALLVAVTLNWQALLESRGAKPVRLAGILIGVLPLMVGAVLCIVSDKLYAVGVWVIGISPLALPVYAASLLDFVELPVSIARAVPNAFLFWLLAYCVAAAWLANDLRKRRKAIAESVLDQT